MPPKAWYLRMERTPDVEFDYFLAHALKKTVAELRESMSNDEWLGGDVYFGRKNQRRERAAKTRGRSAHGGRRADPHRRSERLAAVAENPQQGRPEGSPAGRQRSG